LGDCRINVHGKNIATFYSNSSCGGSVWKRDVSLSNLGRGTGTWSTEHTLDSGVYANADGYKTHDAFDVQVDGDAGSWYSYAYWHSLNTPSTCTGNLTGDDCTWSSDNQKWYCTYPHNGYWRKARFKLKYQKKYAAWTSTGDLYAIGGNEAYR